MPAASVLTAPALDQRRRSRVCHRHAGYEFHVSVGYHGQRRPESEPTSMMATALVSFAGVDFLSPK